MDDQFRHVLDQINPDDGVTERLLHAEVKLFRHALTLLCWGLALTCFHINITGTELALYSTWCGAILLALGLWMLRKENRLLTTAFRCASLLLLTRTASYWLGAFPSTDRSSAYGLGLTALALVLTMTQVFGLFFGLRELALRFANPELARRLARCFWLYASLYALLWICALLPVLLIPLVLYALCVLIRLPVTVHKLKRHVPLGKRVTSVKALSARALLAVCLYIIVTIGGAFGWLYYVNAPKPAASVYTVAHSDEADAMRTRLMALGMPAHVAHDLPDDEVLLFDGIYDASSDTIADSETRNRDGGRLEIVNFVGILPGGKIRTLFYYRWLELPRHTYVDLLALPGTAAHFVAFENREARGMALYDKNGTTYRQTLLNESALVGFSQAQSAGLFGDTLPGGPVTQIQFRLYPDAQNQRGYVAMSSQVTYPEQPLNFNSFSTYVHQERLWNRPHFSALNRTAASGYSHIRNGGGAKAFWSECFYTATYYEPWGWTWPEDMTPGEYWQWREQ